MRFCALSVVLLASLVPCIYGQIAGGIREIPVNDPEVLRLSTVALGKVNENKLSEGESNLVEIVKATRQVVSGTITTLTLRVARGETKRICEVSIWEQPWLSKTEITAFKCEDEHSSKKKRSVEEQDESRKQELAVLDVFNDFIKTHNKAYADYREYKKRFLIFSSNLKKIETLRQNEQGTAQYGLTWFADLTPKEFKNHLGLKMPEQYEEQLPQAEIPDIELPNEFDWRHYNAVTPVKNQKSCGSCWAFSVTGNIEGQWAINKGKLISLSEQELIDCDSTDSGCNGGFMPDTYKAIMKIGGLETESEYPYEAKNDKCHFIKDDAVVTITGAVNITSDEVKMAKWLVKNGPMSIAVNAFAMQFYMGGISHPLKVLCDPKSLDHGVLIVGFGVHHSTILNKTVPYWIIKNSWGTRWGERGYYRLYRGDGSCGVDQMVTSALVN